MGLLLSQGVDRSIKGACTLLHRQAGDFLGKMDAGGWAGVVRGPLQVLRAGNFPGGPFRSVVSHPHGYDRAEMNPRALLS